MSSLMRDAVRARSASAPAASTTRVRTKGPDTSREERQEEPSCAETVSRDRRSFGSLESFGTFESFEACASF
jgi:hypothetical protein